MPSLHLMGNFGNFGPIEIDNIVKQTNGLTLTLSLIQLFN